MEVNLKLGTRIPRVGWNNRRLLPIPLKSELEGFYASGLSTRQLVGVYGVSRGIIRSWMSFYGIPRRNGTGLAKAISQTLKAKGIKPSNKAHDKQRELYGKYFITQKMNDEIVTLYTEGQILSQIAQRFGIGKTAVYQTLIRNKVKCRSASKRTKALWSNPKWAERQVALAVKGAMKRPTKPEQRIIDIIDKYQLPYKYTGNGSFIIAGLNPDFVNCNGAKIALEVFGDYWHIKNAKKRPSYTELGRKAIFSQYGWDLIVLWQSEMDKLTDKQIVDRLSESQNKDKEVMCH